MPDKTPETRGVPPTRPFPSQVMHLLELTRLDLKAAALVVHQPPANIEKWMLFNAKDNIPIAHWLLLNLYTLCVKGVCWPEQIKAFIRGRFPGAIPDDVVPVRKVHIPDRPPIPPVDDMIDMLYDAKAAFEELAYVKKSMVDTWLGPDKRPIPYAVYELSVMTLWARGAYTPAKPMTEYIEKKYYGMFMPKG